MSDLLSKLSMDDPFLYILSHPKRDKSKLEKTFRAWLKMSGRRVVLSNRKIDYSNVPYSIKYTCFNFKSDMACEIEHDMTVLTDCRTYREFEKYWYDHYTVFRQHKRFSYISEYLRKNGHKLTELFYDEQFCRMKNRFDEAYLYFMSLHVCKNRYSANLRKSIHCYDFNRFYDKCSNLKANCLACRERRLSDNYRMVYSRIINELKY